jgi:hypothetical protein
MSGGDVAGDMRAQHDVVAREQRMAARQWFALQHVQAGAGKLPRLERGGERRRVHDRPACDVHEERAGMHAREVRGVHQASRPRRERASEHHEVGARQRVLELLGVGRLRIHDDDLHVERRGAPRDGAADAPVADDRAGAIAQFHVPQAAWPAARLDRPIEPGTALGEREHEVERVLGDRVGVRAAGRRQRNAAPRQRRDIEVVVAGAETARHAQLFSNRYELGRERGALHDHDHPVGLGYGALQFAFGRGGEYLHPYIAAGVEEAHPRHGQRFSEDEGGSSMFHEEESSQC